MARAMNKTISVAASLFVLVLAVGLAAAVALYRAGLASEAVVVAVVSFAVAVALSSALKVAAQWQRALVLRLGRFHALRGPGLFLLIPIVDTVAYWIDIRVITSTFRAEQTLTRDTVPVDVDAVLFWKVIDPEKAALEVESFTNAISWACQTALRDIIGKTVLADMLEGREKISRALQEIIDERTEPWGVRVISVEIRDVLIPPALQNAMSMQAQAERERQARVVLGDSERQIAEKFGEAARTYAKDPVALHLRAMNMLYEGLKQNATIVVVPSSVLETMKLGVSSFTASTSPLGENGRPAEAGAPGERAR
jgi:regulator of protease activity HflC (stomatin/prohibitin superfamily)